MVVSETPDEDQDGQNSLLKELIKLIKGVKPCSATESSKISAINGRCLPA